MNPGENETSVNGLEEFEGILIQTKYYDANQVRRFVNYVIDSIAFLALFVGLALLLGELGAFDNFEEQHFTIFMITLYFIYYFLMEAVIGTTLGKLITRTTIIGINNQKPGTLALLLRTAGRLIPLDALSYVFGIRGFHDFISKTRVVEKPD